MNLTGVVLWMRAFTSDASLLGQTPISALSSLVITVTYGSVGLLLRLRRPRSSSAGCSSGSASCPASTT